jgi:hypothetical protein
MFSNNICRFQSVIENVVDDIQHIAPVAMKLPAFQTVKKIIAVIKGVRVFVDVFLDRNCKE